MSSSKELFNKFKTRPPGTNAGFIVEDGGEMTILDPTQMRAMNPQKLRSRMKKKGVAGTFYKGSKGPVFNVMAGKQGGNAEQPWVKQKLRQELGVSMLEVVTDGGAELEEESATEETAAAPGVAGVELDALGGLDLLDGGDDALTAGLDELPEDLGGLLDALDLPDDAAYQERRGAAAERLDALSAAAARLGALSAGSAGAFAGSHGTWAGRLDELDALSETDPAGAEAGLAGVAAGIQAALDKAGEAEAARIAALRGAAEAALSALKADPKSGWLGSDLTALEAQLAAGDGAVDADPARAHALWSALPDACARAISENADYKSFLAEKEASTQALYALEDHPHKEHLREDITAGETRLHEAHVQAEAGQPGDARALLAQARQQATTGGQRGMSYQEYRTKRAPAYEAARVFDAVLRNPEYVDKVLEADKLTDPPTRDYAGALRKLAEIRTDIEDTLRSWYVDGARTKLAERKAGPCADYISAEIAELETLIAQTEAAIAGGDYLEAQILGSRAYWDVNGAAEKRAARRKVYEDQRAKTRAAVATAAANAHLAGPCAALRAQMAEAEDLASHQKLRIERGTALLVSVEERAQELVPVGQKAAVFWTELKAAEALRAQLTAHPAQHLVDAETKAGAKLILVALAAVGIAPKAPRDTAAAPLSADIEAQEFDGAMDAIRQARAHLDAAQASLAGAVEVVALQSSAEGAEDASALAEIIRKLDARAEALGRSPHASRVEAEQAEVRSACADLLQRCERNPDRERIKGWKKAVDALATLLLTAERVVASHGVFVEGHEEESEQLAALKRSREAAHIEPLLAKVQEQLDKAEGHADAREYIRAARALGQAGVIIEDAEQAANDRQGFDQRAGSAPPSASDLWDRVDQIADEGIKGKAHAHMAAANKAAREIDFDAAHKALDEAESLVKLDDMKGKADRNPADPAVVAQARALMELEGGMAAIDTFVADLPSGPESFALMQELAKERFGIELESDAGFETEAAQRIWKMMALCPDKDVHDNPSLEVVKREDPNSEGGSYNGTKNLVTMKGRPGTSSDQGFGSNIPDELGDVQDDCKPKDEEAVLYFDWATLHEVGHAVDDRLGFMNAREGQDAFGGWTTLTSLDGMIAAVALHCAPRDAAGFRSYVEATVHKGDPTIINEPEDFDGDWMDSVSKLNRWYAHATGKQVWWSESDSQKIKMGDGFIYQEAYSNTWVRYAAGARKKGLTGYQFRAPGEWFAELYAAFHSDKLKAAHPSYGWLSEL